MCGRWAAISAGVSCQEKSEVWEGGDGLSFETEGLGISLYCLAPTRSCEQGEDLETRHGGVVEER